MKTRIVVIFTVVMALLLAIVVPALAAPAFGLPRLQTPIPSFEFTPEFLALVAGAVLSLLFSYVPGLNTWFAGIGSIYQRLLMLAMLAVVTGGVIGLSCASLITAVACTKEGIWGAVQIFILAMIANQSAYAISPQTKVVLVIRGAKPPL
jgi:hypothetical protein